MHQPGPKVLMFGWEFPPFNSGGLGTACYGLTRSLVKNGTDIIFVLPKSMSVHSDLMKIRFADTEQLSWEDELAIQSLQDIREVDVLLYPYITEESYRILYQQAHQQKLKQSYSWSEVQPYAHDLYQEVLRYAKLARKIAKSEKFDIIHAHDWLSIPAGIEAKKTSGKKLIVHIHATEFDRSGNNGVNQKVYDIEREGMHCADKVIAVSHYTKKIIVNNYGVREDKVAVVHNGIDQDYFSHCEQFQSRFQALKDAGNKIILFLGRITIQKGPDYFIRAAKIVLKYEPNVVFLMVGSGDMEKKMMRLAAELGISDKVLFAGFLRGKELHEVYRSSDLYIMPSISEPFGLTVLESMINKTPVVVSKQTGVSEAVSSVLKVDFWDVDEIANKVVSVLRYGALHQCLTEEGHEEIKRVSWMEAANKCIHIYNKLLQSTP